MERLKQGGMYIDLYGDLCYRSCVVSGVDERPIDWRAIRFSDETNGCDYDVDYYIYFKCNYYDKAS